MGFPIKTIQVDNGPEFVNDDDKTGKDSALEKSAKQLEMELRRIRPYSPWQNGKVERSHHEDGKPCINKKYSQVRKNCLCKWPRARDDTIRQQRPVWASRILIR